MATEERKPLNVTDRAGISFRSALIRSLPTKSHVGPAAQLSTQDEAEGLS